MARSATKTYSRAGAAVTGRSTATPQSQPMRPDQVLNNAGGYVWEVSDQIRLDRFLFLGTEGGTYYTKEQKLTEDMAHAVLREIARDGVGTVARILAVSKSGAARKNKPALFALALAATKGDTPTRRAAFAALSGVARTASDMMTFIQFTDTVRGWGRAFRQGVAEWYNSRAVESLGYQLVKYRDREGWNHRDILRMAHASPGSDEARQILYRWAVKGWDDVGTEPHSLAALRQVWAFERLNAIASTAGASTEVLSLIRDHRLPWETIPTGLLKDHAIQEAILDGMPLGAMIRQMGRMTANGFLSNQEPTRVARVIEALKDGDRIRKARVHPMSILAAIKVYEQGHGDEGKLKWTPVPKIIDALSDAFYLAFDTIEPIGQRILLGIDVSDSMNTTRAVGLPNMLAKEAAAAMTLVLSRNEPSVEMIAFDTRPYTLTISGRQRLDDVTKAIGAIRGGGTDCSIPIRVATEKKIPVDLIVILTDSQSWYGTMHPAQAMKEYRDKVSPGAKLAVVAMASNEFSVADPNDTGMMNAIGVDAGVPQVIRNFALGYSTASAPIAESEDEVAVTEDDAA